MVNLALTLFFCVRRCFRGCFLRLHRDACKHYAVRFSSICHSCTLLAKVSAMSIVPMTPAGMLAMKTALLLALSLWCLMTTHPYTYFAFFCRNCRTKSLPSFSRPSWGSHLQRGTTRGRPSVRVCTNCSKNEWKAIPFLLICRLFVRRTTRCATHLLCCTSAGCASSPSDFVSFLPWHSYTIVTDLGCFRTTHS